MTQQQPNRQQPERTPQTRPNTPQPQHERNPERSAAREEVRDPKTKRTDEFEKNPSDRKSAEACGTKGGKGSC